MGNSGSGKSNLARRMVEITKLRLIHMDYFYYEPNWVLRDVDDVVALVTDAIKDDGWVFDGNHSTTHKLRAKKSEIMIWVDIPRWRCIYNVLMRAWKYRGQTRPDMSPECPERMTWDFIKFVWSFNSRGYIKITKLFTDYKDQKRIYHLKSYAEVDAFVEEMKKEYE